MTFPDLQHFARREFDAPDRIDPELLALLDEVRARCGFPIRVNSDLRGADETAGPHAIHDDGLGHAVDVAPAGDLAWEPFEIRKMTIACTAFRLRSVWPNQGIELATRHVHLDNTPDKRRPFYWGAKSQ